MSPTPPTRRLWRAYTFIYAAFVGLVLIGDVTASGGQSGGLLAPTVCISPLVFLIAAALPMETIVTAFIAWAPPRVQEALHERTQAARSTDDDDS